MKGKDYVIIPGTGRKSDPSPPRPLRALGRVLLVALIAAASLAPWHDAAAGNSQTLTVQATIGTTLSLVLSDDFVNFGSMKPDATADTLDAYVAPNPSPPGGACFVARDQVISLVQSNVAWSGTVQAAPVLPDHTAGVTVSDMHWASGALSGFPPPGSLQYSHCTSATAFTTLPGPWIGTQPPTSGYQRINEYAILIHWNTAPGVVKFAVTYTVSPV